MFFRLLLFLILIANFNGLIAEDGYRLWLRYDKLTSLETRNAYAEQFQFISAESNSPIVQSAVTELKRGLSGLLGLDVPYTRQPTAKTAGIILAVTGSSQWVAQHLSPSEAAQLRPEGFIIKNAGPHIAVIGKDPNGVLYGTFHLLRQLQMQIPLATLSTIEHPRIKHRLLNHWDNLDGTVERGYAGFSIWNWHQLPEYLDQRYYDYARANASIGINGTVVTNVNANELVFRADYLQKAAALADIFRAYGIKLYLTARFSAPMELDGLSTADPLAPEVIDWWQKKVDEIYTLIPDFGGFLVKANSEGQPGPQQFGRNHADGANLLADALAPHGGIVMWRAFVYTHEAAEDRANQAYNEFTPLDGKFRSNVMIQVKNGPIDFQPREPIHPLFGAMPQTPLMMEFQITKEYLGQGTHLVGLAKLYEEVLQTDTYAKGPGTTVAKIIDGSADQHALSGMAGVANIGTARNWTGHLFGQADWYAFGRLSWNPDTKADDLFTEWAKLTFSNDPAVYQPIVTMLRTSYPIAVQYMTPLGLHHIMDGGHHYGPGPWINQMPRDDWNSTYYHRADRMGIGFDRTTSGSNALGQYHVNVQKQYADPSSCPPEFLLWFHHLPWDYPLKDGQSLWTALCWQYQSGAERVKELGQTWLSIEDHIDHERFIQVRQHLSIQEKEAQWWRDACLAYFQSVSQLPYPPNITPPPYQLSHYQALTSPYAPGIRPQW